MCSICKQLDCPPGCPNFEPKANKYCVICDNPILPGNEYAQNTNGEYAHDYCIGDYFDLVDFARVKFDVEELESYDDIF